MRSVFLEKPGIGNVLVDLVGFVRVGLEATDFAGKLGIRDFLRGCHPI